PADEFAPEIPNQAMHGILHLGWVPDEDGGRHESGGGYHGEMAVYVKPNGRLGTAYMAAIKPFRHLVVYPPILRRVEQTWRTEPAPPPTSTPDPDLLGPAAFSRRSGR